MSDFFKSVNFKGEASTNNQFVEPDENIVINDEINIPITLEEIGKAVKSLKNNKARGLDKIKN